MNIKASVVAPFVIAAVMNIAIASALAHGADEKEPVPQETPAEKRARMLRAFDIYTSGRGVVVVSFREDVTKDDASAILRAMGLSIKQGERCWTEAVTSPGNEKTPAVSNERCVPAGEIWNEELKYAYAAVPEGREKEYAELLIQNPNIVWVEPELIATAAGKTDDRILETPEERMARMFRAFSDTASFFPGKLIVSFSPSMQRSEALRLLARHGLQFGTREVCGTGAEEAGPDGTIQRTLECRLEDAWNDSLHSATIAVPAGEERAYAERLIAEQGVLWVEPDLIVTVAGEEPGEQAPGENSSERPFLSRFLGYALGGIVLIGVIMLAKRKRK